MYNTVAFTLKVILCGSVVLKLTSNMSSIQETSDYTTTVQNKDASATTRRTNTSPTATLSQRRVAVLLSPFNWKGGRAIHPSSHGQCAECVFDVSPSAVAESRSRKPECSYAVLIGIAMRAAQAANFGNRLPVIDIYRFIEKEFPYFKKCKSTGWKNCVRHCLSLGQFFRKVERSAENVAIKGNYWEVIPDKSPLLNRDIEMFVLDEYKKLVRRKEGKVSPPTRHATSSQGNTETTAATPHTAYVVAQLQPDVHGNSVESAVCSPLLTEGSVVGEANRSILSTPKPQSSVDTEQHQQHINCSSTTPTHFQHMPTVLCTRLTATSPDSSVYADEEHPLPCSSLVSGRRQPYSESPQVYQQSERHVPSENDGNVKISARNEESVSCVPSMIDSVGNAQKDCSRCGINVYSDVFSTPTCSTLHSSYTECNTEQCISKIPSFESDGELHEENPLINPTHPIVNTGTLAAINSGNALSDFSMTTAFNTVTYVMAPIQGKTNFCHPTPSGSSAARMSHGIFSPQHPVQKHFVNKPASPYCFNTLHMTNHRLHFKEEYIPPAIQPFLSHMNDPSHFLPSCKYYSPPPYEPRWTPRKADVFETCVTPQANSEKSSTKGDDTLNKMSAAIGSQEHIPAQCQTERDRYTTTYNQKQSPLQQLQLTKPQSQMGDRFNHSVRDISREEHYQSSNNNHTPPEPNSTSADEAANGEHIFEVSSDWMKLTIAREEEVASSLLEEVTRNLDLSPTQLY